MNNPDEMYVPISLIYREMLAMVEIFLPYIGLNV